MLVRHVLQAKGWGAIYLGCNATVEEALGLFIPHNIGSLPVVDAQGRLIGIFTERDVLHRVHEDYEHLRGRQIREVMSPNPITCTPDDSVQEVMSRMSQHRVGQLPVLDGDELAGLVTVSDLIQAMYEQIETENQHMLTYVYGRT